MTQCWAYDQRQRRCEQDAGHEGNHAILIDWTDEECYKPEVAVRPAVVSRETENFKEEKKPAACAACQHRHKGGACKCGCYNQIG